MRARAGAVLLLAGWVALSAANQHSIARWEPLTVLVLGLAAPALLALLVATRRSGLGPLPGWAAPAALVACAVAALQGRWFGYLPADVQQASAAVAAGGAVAAAALLLVRRAGAAVAVAGASLVVTTSLAVRYDPVPRIDVWYSVDRAAAGLLTGDNPYTTDWYGSPGVGDAFTYLPMTAVLLAPVQWLLGDVRWGLLLALLLAGWLLARRRPAARPLVPLLWLTPGQLVQTEQAWTEPLLLCALTAVLVLAGGGRRGGAVGALAAGLATKQHLALLLPSLAAWRPVGPVRAAAAAAVAGLLCLPFVVADLGAFLHDTVVLLLDYPPLPLSPNLYIALLREGHEPPFWLTGLVTLVAVLGTALVVRREQPAPARLALLWALLLLVLNLVNKQAFYNQFWLSGVLLLVALGLSAPAAPSPSTSGRERVSTSA
ncbi:hypothetical protein [Vallicoccus soli]|uniref:DUF2029 domain-containing protein n=1 Tax=Vallicoccus soli TaxID=2339232 RepID=A0A3A3Z7S1_9ACTN|nr:hypothetical protein [Vallicoccus soli]RJK96887.1 hypothetical protein D5H78_06440 [Vallicoccus soli]